MKSKIRVKKAEGGGCYAVKTSKFVDADGVQDIRQKQLRAKAHSRRVKNNAEKKKSGKYQ
jgi:hypothetical protein